MLRDMEGSHQGLQGYYSTLIEIYYKLKELGAHSHHLILTDDETCQNA